jgi:hypothetical protein
MPNSSPSRSASASASATRKNKPLTAKVKAEIIDMIRKFNEIHVPRMLVRQGVFNSLRPPSKKAGAGPGGGRRTRRRNRH